MTDADEASYATRRRVLQGLGIGALALGASRAHASDVRLPLPSVQHSHLLVPRHAHCRAGCVPVCHFAESSPRSPRLGTLIPETCR